MISLLLALSLSTAAPATAASPVVSDTDKPAKSVKRKKVCQKIEVTGSSVPKRVCRTVTEPQKAGDDTEQAAADKVAAGNTH